MYCSTYSAIEDADLFVCFLVVGQVKKGIVGAESEKGGEPSVNDVC